MVCNGSAAQFSNITRENPVREIQLPHCQPTDRCTFSNGFARSTTSEVAHLLLPTTRESKLYISNKQGSSTLQPPLHLPNMRAPPTCSYVSLSISSPLELSSTPTTDSVFRWSHSLVDEKHGGTSLYRPYPRYLCLSNNLTILSHILSLQPRRTWMKAIRFNTKAPLNALSASSCFLSFFFSRSLSLIVWTSSPTCQCIHRSWFFLCSALFVGVAS